MLRNTTAQDVPLALVVYLDHKLSGLFLEEPQQVAYFQGEADRLMTMAQNPEDSAEFVATIAKDFERG